MSTRVLSSSITLAMLLAAGVASGQFVARDPGLRGGPRSAGDMLTGLTATQKAVFAAGREDFEEEDGIGSGLGPRFNLDSCAGCHAQPATGGTSPIINPQIEVATKFGARNTMPTFIRADGPVREVRARYKPDGSRDGGVHALFVISGRKDGTGDATDCRITQDDFETMAARGNLSFRIPTPTFGLGLVEQIPDSAIIANSRASVTQKTALGIAGRPHRLLPTGNANRNGNDGTVARFGWKAQNKSLLLFAGEAYNVEQGISNELFPSERDETAECQYAPTPNDTINTDGATAADVLSGIQRFAAFMRFLAPPRPSADTPGGAPSIARGKTLFTSTGCALCHTPMMRTGMHASVAALSDQPVALYSDLLLHNMGQRLADDIVQGEASGDEFRTAPLWGLGQRIFFLHDGRTKDLVEAIQAHASAGDGRFRASEANGVVARFRALSETQKQDVLNFLRSL
jgi:CxxC motif-containing protein (DUF1111 family)